MFNTIGMWALTLVSTFLIIAIGIDIFININSYIKKLWLSLIISTILTVTIIMLFSSAIYYISEELFNIILIIFFGGYISIFGG